MTAAWRLDGAPWRELAAAQCGVLTRAQLLEAGWSRDDIDTARRFAGWTGLGGGVFAVHRGPLPPPARAWAAVLRCGPEAALAGSSALSAWGVTVAAEPRWHVAVSHDRHPRVPDAICLHRVDDHDARVHPTAQPPRHRVEPALLDAVAEARTPMQVVGLAIPVIAARLTTPDRLDAELARRSRLRNRSLLAGVLADARTGVASCLEAEYLRLVQRPHRLPRPELNAPDGLGTRRVYRDVSYGRVVVELDGVAHHGLDMAVSDRRRDNDLVVQGRRTLRFGWAEVLSDPCGVAATIALALGGYEFARPCGRGCTLRAAA